MTINQNNLVTITIVLSVTLIGVIALARNSDTEIDIKLGGDTSVNIKGQRSLPPPLKTNDCPPSAENSHRLNCDNH
ncbi:hypothetical protein [Myxosarcina sp. GI1]|uniref:hypothetical protein n=1 Tax=Myxosarcina sp. GI1 TaxID=1541065 RepID=UPI0012E05AEF|nr:hypothetical protein [Myxosarcina sp. GI1]